MYIYTYVQQPMESQIESLPKVDIPARTVGSQLPQGYIRSPVAQWYGRGQRQEPGCRSPAQNGSRHGPENGMPRASGKPGISVAIKKVFHMGIFRFPSGIITKKSNLPWLEDMVPTIKNWRMPRPPKKWDSTYSCHGETKNRLGISWPPKTPFYVERFRSIPNGHCTTAFHVQIREHKGTNDLSSSCPPPAGPIDSQPHWWRNRLISWQ